MNNNTQPHLCHLIPNSPGTLMQNVNDVTQFHDQELSSAHPVQNFDNMKNKLINEVLDAERN